MQLISSLGTVFAVVLFFVIIPGGLIRNGIQRGYSPQRCVLQTTGFMLGLLILLAIFTHRVMDPNPWAVWKREFETSLTASLQLYREWGWNADELQRAAFMIRLVFVEGLLGWLTVISGLFAFVLQIGQQRRLQTRSESKKVLRFTQWPTADHMIWPLMVAFLLILFGERLLGWPRWIAVNSLLVLGAYYFMMGLAVLFFYLEQRKAQRFLKVMVFILMLFLPGFGFFVTGIGIFDTWWDWRRLQSPAPPRNTR